MNDKYINNLIVGDAFTELSRLEDNSIDLVLTDPPYFLDKMDNDWNHEKIISTKNHYVVKSLPAGMKFDREQGKKLYGWYLKISQEILRILKPGGFFFTFSSPRLYHRVASAVDDAGFLLRDSFIWLYTQNQVKAMSLNHFIDRLNYDDLTKEKLRSKLKGWKTPQIKSCYEPIVIAQKEQDNTFLENILKYQVGLFNTEIKIGNNMYPSNVLAVEEIDELIDRYFLIDKPDKSEKGEFNNHRTVKPLALCEYLIALSTFSDNAVVLDPFIGSGTVAVAAKKLNRKFIGIDINEKYIEIAKLRLNALDNNTLKQFSTENPKITADLFESKSV